MKYAIPFIYLNMLSIYLGVTLDDLASLRKRMGKDILSFYVCHGTAVIIGSETILIRLYHHPVSLLRNPICYGARGGALILYSSCFQGKGLLPELTLLAFPLSILHPSSGRGSDLPIWCIEERSCALLLLSQGMHSPFSSKP